MRVRQGWSGETETNVWQKVDIDLDETDLFRLFNGAGGYNNFPTLSALGTEVAHKLLSNEAEILLLNKLVDLGYPKDTAKERQSLLTGQNQAIIAALKKTMA